MNLPRIVTGACPLDCQDTCAWEVQVDGEGRVVRLAGANAHPFTRGALCAKVNDYHLKTYAPDRLLYPLRRIGPKGEGRFERVSWDEALDEIASRFRAIVDEYGGEALWTHDFIGSIGVMQRRSLLRIFRALGASRVTGSVCGASGNVAEAEGVPRGFDPEEIEHAELILLWGCNLLTTSHHGFHAIQQARKNRNARVICIDPRRTRTADRCDEHIPIRPGTDHVLAAGMASVMIEEGLVDLDYGRAVSVDLDEYVAEVRPWTPERVAGVCGVSPDNVVRLAREFARARPACIRAGVAVQQSVSGDEIFRSLSSLCILAGHWEMRGGGYFTETQPVLHDGRVAAAVNGPAARALDMARFADNLLDADLQPPVMGLTVWSANPVAHQPDARRTLEAVSRDDLFMVVIEHMLTDTARYADIVLPSTTQLEHFDILGAWGHHYITVNNPAIAPLGESKSHGEIMRLLAPRLGLTGTPFEQSDEEVAASALPDGITLDELKERRWYKSSPPRPDLRNGRPVRLSFAVTEAECPQESAPFRLLTPKSHYFMNSTFVNIEKHRSRELRPTLEMSQEDAERSGLEDGARVRIENDQGSVEAWLAVSDRIVAGVVSLPGKWWSDPAHGGGLANVLTPHRHTKAGQPQYNDTFVRVTSPDG